jgi:7,8-dihydropterin-6-yl-methyl-4-(beta-D-ribofuranosyl)aminobenzene 5'-phosphate synthase
LETGVERVVITTVVEGYVDMLLGGGENFARQGMDHYFDPRTTNPMAENGLSLLIEVYSGDNVTTILFDVGLTPSLIRNNFKALGIDPTTIDHIVISHGHPDHYAGLSGALDAIGYSVPVAIHPDAFYPRYVVTSAGQVIPDYNNDLIALRKENRAAFVEVTSPMSIAPGTKISGVVSRTVDFEPPRTEEGKGSTLIQVKDGVWQIDDTLDDLCIGINVKDKGLIVITGCAHTGIINSIKHMQKVTGIERVYAVLGGFHLGFPGVPERNIVNTVNELKKLDPKYVSPMHCSGFKTMFAFQKEMPDAFLLNTVGTKIEF